MRMKLFHASNQQQIDHLETEVNAWLDAQEFLASVGTGRSTKRYKPKKTIFRQGDPANAVFYILEGGVKLTVV